MRAIHRVVSKCGRPIVATHAANGGDGSTWFSNSFGVPAGFPRGDYGPRERAGGSASAISKWLRLPDNLGATELDCAGVYMAGLITPVAALISRAQLLVMPSSYEPLGMAQIEALAIEVPVIASRTGGTPETIDHAVTGLLVEPNSIDAWADALNQALSDLPKMRAIAKVGRERVRTRFSIDNNLQQILRISGLSRDV
jgi:hypothetical protein